MTPPEIDALLGADHREAQIWAAATLMGSIHTDIERLKNVARAYAELVETVERYRQIVGPALAEAGIV